MNANTIAIQTCIKLVCQGVTFPATITSLSTYIAITFPLINPKGHKALVSEIGTGSGDGKKSRFFSHLNGILFMANNWESKWSYEQYKCFLTQVKKFIGFAKMYKIDETQDAFIADKERGR